MAEVTIYINGRSYDISCDNGQEGRVVDLASYIDQRLQMISRSGAAYNDAHLMVLTAIVLADEIFDARSGQPAAARTAAPAPAAKDNSRDEAAIVKMLEQITKRIEGVATKVAQAS